MADEILRWASLVAPVILFIGAWVKFGELKQTVSDLAHQMTMVTGKQELLRDDVARHREEVAKSYATREEIRDAFQSINRTLERLGDRIDDAIKGRET